MRRPLAFALLVLLAVPSAVAQGEVVPPFLEVRVDPLDEPVRPLSEVRETTLTTRASCLLSGDAQRVSLRYGIADAPAWVTAVVTPASDVVDARGCDGGYVTAEAAVRLTVDADAPAFTPMPVRLVVTAGPPEREEQAETTLNVSADYFSILEVHAEEPIRVALPDSLVEVPVTVANFGNDRTRVQIELIKADTGLSVELPQVPLLGSRQHGDAETAATVDVGIRTADANGFINEVGVVLLRLRAVHAEDPSLPGDDTMLSLLVTTKSQSLMAAEYESGNRTPALGALPALVALGALARVVRLRR